MENLSVTILPLPNISFSKVNHVFKSLDVWITYWLPSSAGNINWTCPFANTLDFNWNRGALSASLGELPKNILVAVFRSSSVTKRLGTTSIFVSRFSGDNNESLTILMAMVAVIVHTDTCDGWRWTLMHNYTPRTIAHTAGPQAHWHKHTSEKTRTPGPRQIQYLTSRNRQP